MASSTTTSPNFHHKWSAMDTGSHDATGQTPLTYRLQFVSHDTKL